MTHLKFRHLLATLVALTLLAGCATAKPTNPAPGATAPGTIPGTSTPPPAPQPASHPWKTDDPHPTMASFSHPAPAKRTQYVLDVQVDPVAMRLNAKQTVRFTNNETANLSSLVFHLFANAPYFQKEESGAARIRPGVLAIDDLNVDGQKVPAVQKADGQAVEVPLPKPLAPGQTTEVVLTWHEVVPSTDDRLGVIGPAIYLGNFYPILAIHDQDGWHMDKYIEMGDPFFSEVADYDVTFTMPNGYQVAATGHYAAPQKAGDADTKFHFTAQNVRDFAAAASSQWALYEADVDGIHVRYFRDKIGTRTKYTTPDILPPEEAMKHITGSLHFFSDKFGKYPYPDFTVVDHIGMEYPQLIMAEATMQVIPHEIAHQWWFGVVGNDEVRQLWDEGLTEWSSMYYQAAFNLPNARPFSVNSSEAMNKTLYVYWAHSHQQTPLNYGSTIYGRGWALWESLHQEMGTAAFEKMIQDFYSAHKFAIATWDDWRQLIKERAGDKGVAIFDTYVTNEQIPATPPTTVAKP